tara:strand:+ start:235 stop:1494 length:1260 start_codon:yes stop_codon:yes gene_type:complete
VRTFHLRKESALSFGALIAFSAIPLVQAKPTKPAGFAPIVSEEVATSTLGEKSLEQEIHVEKPDISHNPADCDIFDDPNSVACLGPVKGFEPTNNFERLVQKGASYATRFVPMLNNGAKGSAYSEAIKNDGKAFLIGGINSEGNAYINDQIQKVPFFAQTTISINTRTKGETSFSLDSLMKLKEITTDSQGDLRTLLFSQARVAIVTDGNGATTNLGLGIRHRPSEKSMLGLNTFWDYRITEYNADHSRLGVGGEWLRDGFELRNNWYIAITDEKTVSIGGNEYSERVVPGWDVEVGYRFPKNPGLAFFARGFNWDYAHTQDNSGAEGAVSWQATPNINLEAWVSNEIDAGKTVLNTALPSTDEIFFGLRFKWSGQPVKLSKTNTKAKMINQMTQPVRRRYEVLLERSTGSFTNRASGS